jgi:hypothetical protein
MPGCSAVGASPELGVAAHHPKVVPHAATIRWRDWSRYGVGGSGDWFDNKSVVLKGAGDHDTIQLPFHCKV